MRESDSKCRFPSLRSPETRCTQTIGARKPAGCNASSRHHSAPKERHSVAHGVSRGLDMPCPLPLPLSRPRGRGVPTSGRGRFQPKAYALGYVSPPSPGFQSGIRFRTYVAELQRFDYESVSELISALKDFGFGPSHEFD